MTIVQGIQIGLLGGLGLIVLTLEGPETQLPALGIAAVLTATTSPWLGVAWLLIWLLVVRNKVNDIVFWRHDG